MRRALDAGSDEDLVEIIARRPLEVWFMLPSQELFRLLDGLPAEMRDPHPVLSSLYQLFVHGGDPVPSHAAWAESPTPAPALGVGSVAESTSFARFVHLRAQGHIRRAAEELEQVVLPSRANLVDGSSGWECFLAVQAGITGMLAGDFEQALASFTSAALMPTPPELRFLIRDAYAKAALIHAIFGDQYTAQGLLQRAGEIARTESWAESGIDICITLAKTVLNRETPRPRLLARLDALPLQDLGEMWPFFILVMQRLYLMADRQEDVVARLGMYEAAAFPRVPGECVPGSVFATAIAGSLMFLGRMEEAERKLAEADPRIASTAIVRALIEVRGGRFAEALATAGAIEPETRSLRQFEIWRASLAAVAMIGLGDHRGGLDALRHLNRRMGNLGVHELLVPMHYLEDFVRAQTGEWPFPNLASAAEAAAPAIGLRLTERETEVLGLIGQGLKRGEIAARLFVSVNTVKSHQRSLFKKFEVSRASDLVYEARSRGLL